MELSVWAGNWGLPSVDIQCLQAMVNIFSYFLGKNASLKYLPPRSRSVFFFQKSQFHRPPINP